MVNLLAVKIIVLIIVTNCYIVDFQYALLVSSHRDCLFLSYCGISMHKLIAIHCSPFCPIQQHPLDYMVLLLFSWDPQGAYKEQGFLYIINYRACSLYNCLCELHPCTHYMGNYTKRTLSIWDISFHVYLYLNCRHISLKS